MPFYYGLPYDKEQLVTLFATHHGVKIADEPTTEELFELIKLCEDWDHDGEYDDVEENITYLVNELLQYEKEFHPYLFFHGDDEYFIGLQLSVTGPISVQDIDASPAEKEEFMKSPLYPHLREVPRVYYM